MSGASRYRLSAPRKRQAAAPDFALNVFEAIYFNVRGMKESNNRDQGSFGSYTERNAVQRTPRTGVQRHAGGEPPVPFSR